MNVRRTGILVGAVLAVLGCGGAEDKPSNAPLPEAWVREDQGANGRPGSTVIGSPAPPGGRGTPRAASAPGQERARLAQLRSHWEAVWDLAPGDERAEHACAEHARLARLARQWVRTLVGAAPDADAEQRLRDGSLDLRESLDALAAACTSGGPLDGPEPVEGAWHGVGAEVDELDSLARGVLGL